MRRVLIAVRLVLAALAAAVLTLGVAPPAPAAPAAAPVVVPAALAASKKACTITNEKMDELSGIVATADGYAVVNDSTTSASRKRVFLLDNKCKLRTERGFRTDPRDPEDIALSPDGKTLWIADVGDNDSDRGTVALWSMPVSGSAKATIHRLAYPDGPHDAEALLLPGSGIPYIVTKASGKSAIYAPATTAAKLAKNTANGTPMRKLGEITLPKTTTDNRFGPIGRLLVTGGAVSPDGTKVVLRTYADAFEYDIAGGDLVKALTTNATPRATPLASDVFGEGISYTADGASFVTVSDLGDLGTDAGNGIWSHTPATAAAKPAGQPGGAGAADDKPSWFADLSLTDITYLLGALGLVGLILVAVGVIAIVLFRHRPPTDDDPDDDDPDPDLVSPVQEPSVTRGGVYNSARAGGTEYGARAFEPAGTTYGAPATGPAGGPPRVGAPGGGRSGGTYRSGGYDPDGRDPDAHDPDGYDPDYDPAYDPGYEAPPRQRPDSRAPRDPRHPGSGGGRSAGGRPAGREYGPEGGDRGPWDGGHDADGWASDGWESDGRESGGRAPGGRAPGGRDSGWDQDGSDGWDAGTGWDRPAPSSPAPAPPHAPPPGGRRGEGRGGAVYGGRRPVDPNYPPAYDDQYDYREPDPYSRY